MQMVYVRSFDCQLSVGGRRQDVPARDRNVRAARDFNKHASIARVMTRHGDPRAATGSWYGWLAGLQSGE